MIKERKIFFGSVGDAVKDSLHFIRITAQTRVTFKGDDCKNEGKDVFVLDGIVNLTNGSSRK